MNLEDKKKKPEKKKKPYILCSECGSATNHPSGVCTYCRQIKDREEGKK